MQTVKPNGVIPVMVGKEFFDSAVESVCVNVGDYIVDGLDIASSQVRNAVVTVMKLQYPEVYAEYRTRKYLNAKVNPCLADRRSAYTWLFSQFIERTYNIAGF